MIFCSKCFDSKVDCYGNKIYVTAFQQQLSEVDEDQNHA